MKKVLIILIVSLIVLVLCVSCAIPAVSHYTTRRLLKTIEANDYEGFQKEIKYCFNINGLPYSKIVCWMSEWTYRTPLQEACRVGNYQMVSDLIAYGADVNHVEFYAPFSPLMQAVMCESDSNLEIVKLLLDNGADAKYRKKTYDADALYQLAACTKQIPNATAIIDLLVQNGADVYYSHKSYGTLLNIACFEGRNPEIIKHLVEQYGINPKTGRAGRTVLIDYCKRNGNIEEEIVQLLLDYGVDKNVADEDGKTAYDCALQSECANQAVLDLLKPTV